jgi:hypothetical protein
MSGVLANITALQGFNNSKLIPDKPVIVEDFDWGGIFVYKSGDLPPGTIGINSGINPGFHWVDLVGNFVVNYAANNLATQNHTHDSTQITDLNSWGVGWLPTQSIDASQIVNLVFPSAPVDSVNGQTGIVNLTAADVGAIASGSITITTAEITDWGTAFQAEFASLIVGAVIDFSQITNIPLESPVNWDDVESKPTFLLDFEALSISALQGFLYHSGADIWELRESLTIADITNLQTTIDGKQASHPSLSALSTIGDNANTGYFKKTGLNSWQVANSIAWEELSGIPTNLEGIGVATLTGDGLLRRDGGTWAIAPQIDWGELGNIPTNLGEVAAIATVGYLKRAADGTIEAVEEVVKPPRPGTWGAIVPYEVGDVPIIVVPEDLVTNQRYISFSTDESININIYCGVGEPPDLTISPPKYSFILRPGKQITDNDFFHNGQAIWAVTPASTQVLNVQIASAAIDYTGAEDLSNYQDKAAKGQPNGYASLDANSKILQANIPAIAIVDTHVVTSELEMLGLTAEVGDVAIRTDTSTSYILQGNDPTLLTDWQELLSPGEVSSVNGQVGTVLIDNISGNAATATALETPRTISSSGDITWDVTFNGSSNVDGVAAIAANVVNNSKLAAMTAGTIKGSELGGNPQDLTASQVLGIINVETGATANSTDAVLLARANHTGTQFAATISDFDTEVANNTAVAANTAKITNATHTGEVTGNSVLTIADGVVGNSKLIDMAESTIKGRITTGTGDPEDLTAAQVRSLLNLVVDIDVQAFSLELNAIAGLTSSANQLPLFTGAGTASLLPISTYAQGLLSDTNAATARTTLGLGDISTQNSNSISITGGNISGISPLEIESGGTGGNDASTAIANLGLSKAILSDATGIVGGIEIKGVIAITQQDFDNLPIKNEDWIYQITDAPNLSSEVDTTISTYSSGVLAAIDAAAARTELGVEIGADIQGFSVELDAIADLASTTDTVPYFTGLGTAALAPITSFSRNLLDDPDSATARTTLGLGDSAVLNSAFLLARENHTGNQLATTITYDNSSSGLAATELQAAIDEVAAGGGGGTGSEITSDVTGIAGALQVHNIVIISPEDYDDLVSPDPNTIYFLV